MCGCNDYQVTQAKRNKLSDTLSFAPTTSRRQALALLGAGALSLGFARESMAQVAFAPAGKSADGQVLVVLFLRGGMDGLNAVVPYREDAYHKARPALRLGAPSDAKVAVTDRVLDLDGTFGFHPSLEPMLDLFHRGQLAVVHGVGSLDRSRSHFEAMSAMERGIATNTEGSQEGWLARYLTATEGSGGSPLRAVALGSTMPDSLKGSGQALAIEDMGKFNLGGDAAFKTDLAALYRHGADPFAAAGAETLQVLDTLKNVDFSGKAQSDYPQSSLGATLRQLSLLIKARVGLEIAAVEKGGWDTHVAQGAGQGYFALQLADVASSIKAFLNDLGSDRGRVALIVQTEFGRRLEENAGLGTDHGRASVMFLAGPKVAGGKVYANWKGLRHCDLEDGLDLAVTTDYRSVLAQALQRTGKSANLAPVFPGCKAEVLNDATVQRIFAS